MAIITQDQKFHKIYLSKIKYLVKQIAFGWNVMKIYKRNVNVIAYWMP